MKQETIWGNFFKKSVIPIMLTVLLFFIFKPLCTENGKTNYWLVVIFCGIPFGIGQIVIWMFDGGTGVLLGNIILNLLIGGIIGCFILAWRLLRAIFYLFLTPFLLIDAYDHKSQGYQPYPEGTPPQQKNQDQDKEVY